MLGSSGKYVSGTICQELALRVLRTNGTGHLFPAHYLGSLEPNFRVADLARDWVGDGSSKTGWC